MPRANDPAIALMSGLEGIVLIYDELNRQPTQTGNLSTAEEKYAIRASSVPPGLPMKALRKKTGYSSTSLSRVTAKLEDNGFLEKNIDGANGRCRILRATEKGKEALTTLDQRAFQIFKSREPELVDRLREFLNALKPFAKSADNATEKAAEQKDQQPKQKEKEPRPKRRGIPISKSQGFLSFT